MQVHFCDEHAWVVEHAAHTAPPLPQAVFVVPGWQVPPESQQPLGQLAALQVCGRSLHTLLWQACATGVEAQTAQAPPPVPQAVCVLPGWQFPLLSQQPVGHVDGLHVMLTHVWLWHCCPVPQVAQAAPPLPQAPAFVPATHAPPLQHPLGQVVALQVPAEQD